MSISSIQKKRKTKEFQMKLLQRGIEPNNFELNKMLTEYFDNHMIGMPSYSPIKQKPYEESSKDDYNHNFETFKEDIETIYEANIETNNKAVAMQEYYDIEKNKVRNALAKLELRVKNITESLKCPYNTKEYVQVFDDMYSIEFYGNTKRNIPYTTAFVDLLQKKIYTDKTCSKVNKLSLANATISIEGLLNFKSYTEQGNLNNVLNDTISDIYILNAKDDNGTNVKKLSINIDIGHLVTLNTVSFSFTSTREVTCELYLSEDGSNYVPAYDITARDYIEWNFKEKTIRYIKINYLKDEADNISDDDNAYSDYYYLFKNISIAKEEFELKSTFVSKIIKFNELTSTIKLDAQDMIFNNTRIDYFIGYDNGIDKIGWDAIENHKEQQLFMFEKKHKILNYHVHEFGHLGSMLDLYRLYEIPQGVNRNSIKLTPGYNMWHVKKYNRINGDSDDGFSIQTEDFSSYAVNCTLSNLFMDCENYDRFEIDTNVLYIMTQYISLEQSSNTLNHFIKVVDNITVDDNNAINKVKSEIRVFLNGCEIMPGDNNNYSFAMKKGVNKIQIAIYCPSSIAKTSYLYHNFNFKNLTNNIFACTPMKYTNNQILDKTIGETYSYYTIKDNYIYVKCNPDDMIKSNIEDMGYFISYYGLRNDMKNYFKDNNVSFRIMAVLTSNDKNVSPQLINFRITGK